MHKLNFSCTSCPFGPFLSDTGREEEEAFLGTLNVVIGQVMITDLENLLGFRGNITQE